MSTNSIYLDINGDIINEIFDLEPENRIDEILENLVESSPNIKKVSKKDKKVKEPKKEKKKDKDKKKKRVIKIKKRKKE